MRKLIQMHQEHLIVCDNEACDFKILNETGDPNVSIEKYLNVACPKCGENLLTERDYLDSLKFLRMVNFINRWFSWITIFIPKSKKPHVASAHAHNGISFEMIEDEDITHMFKDDSI